MCVVPARSSGLFLLCVSLSVQSAAGRYPNASLSEIAQRADLIFIGTVLNETSRFDLSGRSIVTDVVFGDIRLIHATEISKQKRSSNITLTHEGGTVGDLRMGVSVEPHFRTGAKYLVFMRDDGKFYVNPIVGGPMGKFEVVQDAVTGAEHLLNATGKGMIRSSQPEPQFTQHRITTISAGIPQIHMSQGIAERNVPVSVPHDATSRSARFAPSTDDGVQLMDLEEFLQEIRSVYLVMPPPEQHLRFDGVGAMYRRSGGEVIRENLRTGNAVNPLSLSARVVPMASVSQSLRAEPTPIQTTILGGTLTCFGYHNLKLVMEQVPVSWWSFSIQNDCMWTWNQFVDVYRFSDDDGTYQWKNGQNEFVGFVTDEDLLREYNLQWNGYLAMVRSWGSSTSGEIYESDLMYNAAYNWTPDAELAIGNPVVRSLRPATMHELGHTWGEQNGAEETYDYDVPSVMHSLYPSIVEDGWGIHAADAKLFRENYRNQSAPTSIRDVGVESYRASGGLISAAIVTSRPSPGTTIELQGVTIENMSSSALSDVRIRFFLSTDRTVTTSDYQLGSYSSWTSFPAETHTVESYLCTIPENVPPGTYYVGAVVTINGFDSDDYPYNNATSFLHTITVYEPITISGRVLEYGTGVGLSNVEMMGLPGSPRTDAEGRYSAVVSYRWTGAVRPTSTTHSFTPELVVYSNVTTNQVTGYAGTINTIPVSGYVQTQGGVGISGVTLTGLPSPPVTAANGGFVRMVPTGWSGVVKPVKESHRFSPDSVVLTNVTSLQSCSFVGTKIEFTISGQITIGPRVFLQGAVMNGLPGSPVTDASGRYSAQVDSGWSGMVTPMKQNYLFTPPSITYVNVTANPSTKLSSYTAQLRPLLISGVVRTAGGASIAGVLMDGLPGAPLTDTLGCFTDSVSFFWDGHVQPVKAGYSFTPYNLFFNKLASDTVLTYVGIGPPAPVSLTVATYPKGLRIVVDDSARVGPYAFQTLEGAMHTISADSVLSTGFGTRARWVLWLDGRARTHTVVPTRDTFFVALFATEYELNVTSSPANGGITQPTGSKWWGPSHQDTIRATPSSGYAFMGWQGDIISSENPTVVSLDRPRTIVAKFEPLSDVGSSRTAAAFSLGQAYPNPFNPSAIIQYAVPVRGHVLLEVFDMLGTCRATLVDGSQEAGYHQVRFDATGFSSGVYLYTMQTGSFRETRRMILIR